MDAGLDSRFSHRTYVIRRKFFKLFGAAFHIYLPDGSVGFYSKQKAFKLREDIRIYTGEDVSREVLTIKARQIIDWSAAYDVVDPASGRKIGALKRKGWRSLVRDEWVLMDAEDRELGSIKEDSTALALVRRFLTALLPQRFHVEMGGNAVAAFHQHFNPFLFKMTMDFSADGARALDRRLGLAAGVLLAAIEGRQG